LAEVPEWSEDEIAGLEPTLLAHGMSPGEVRAFLQNVRDVRSSPAFEQRLAYLSAADELAALPITEDEIRSEGGDDRLIERIYQHLLDRNGGTEPLGARLPDLQRALVVTTWFEGDVFNGGLSQYVMNQDDNAEASLAMVVDGYSTIGIEDMAAIAGDVLKVVEAECDLRQRLERWRLSGDAWQMYEEQTALTTFDPAVRSTVAERAAFIRDHAGAFAD
jgi:hypothetical protein